MSTLTVSDFLKYADLQMAAEAFIRDPLSLNLAVSGDELKAVLLRGNVHTSKFTETQATNFVDSVKGWTVLDQQKNTPTGFSGTLFKNNSTGELVMSFRSTEFIDDSVRDNLATNTLEVKDTGWAWGQITYMEAWYKTLIADGGLLQGKQFAVTGYSLGGHLATAFNLLRREDGTQDHITNVVTFNGAGVGEIRYGTLTEALDTFNKLRTDSAELKKVLDISVPELSNLFDKIDAKLKNRSWTATEAKQALVDLNISINRGQEEIDRLATEKRRIYTALDQIISLQKEVEYLKTLTEGGTGQSTSNRVPNDVPNEKILAEDFDYRLAVALTSNPTGFNKRTNGVSLLGAAQLAYEGKQYLGPRLDNQFDVMGDTMPSAISNSLWHYGTEVQIAIEDQPLYRGGVGKAVLDSLDSGIHLLVSGYAEKDFGDTHMRADSRHAPPPDSTRTPDAERLHRELQPQVPGRMPQRAVV